MKLLSKSYDERVESTNVLVEVTIKEYLRFAPKLIEKRNNEFQRRRVRAAGRIYSLLKEDLGKGCIVPPIVLAHTDLKDYENMTDDDLVRYIETNAEDFLIIDGLQRTYTFMDAEPGSYDCISNLRLEIYLGIRKQAVLYRMLTLNSGQMPMSLRHQIEILYSNYLKIPTDEGIKLITGADKPGKVGEYNFSDVIDGFHSYIRRNALPIDRETVLENIKSLSGLSKSLSSPRKEEQKDDLFHEYLTTFHSFFTKMESLYGDWKYEKSDYYEFPGKPFGKNVKSIFSKPAVMTGFGSAVGKLVDKKVIAGFKELRSIIEDPEFWHNDSERSLNALLITLGYMRLSAEKIGNSQRLFFHYFFRELFNKNSDSYGNIDAAVENGHDKYEIEVEL